MVVPIWARNISRRLLGVQVLMRDRDGHMNSPKSRLQRILASVPVNATAARVIGSSGAEIPFVAEASRGDTRHFLVPPPIVPTEELRTRQARETAQKLIGQRFGRFTVLGYAADQPENNKRKARWVVRCDCGSYEYRTAKAISNPANNVVDRCLVCRDDAYHGRKYEQLGPRDFEEFR